MHRGVIALYAWKSPHLRPYGGICFDGLATFEAIARALGILEGVGIQHELEKVFTMLVDRLLWARGKKSSKDCLGGIPPEAFQG